MTDQEVLALFHEPLRPEEIVSSLRSNRRSDRALGCHGTSQGEAEFASCSLPRMAVFGASRPLPRVPAKVP
jgi:hypothetical protein